MKLTKKRTLKRTLNHTLNHFKLLSVLCLSLLITGSLLSGCGQRNAAPDPEFVQVFNPMMEVSSVKEMEEYLDFSIPVLDKEVDRYIVLVIDGYPTMGRIYYTDGGVFSIQYGTGDISGIYGGSLEKTEPVNGVKVSYYTYEATRYALWETNGFTYSLTGGIALEEEVAALIP